MGAFSARQFEIVEKDIARIVVALADVTISVTTVREAVAATQDGKAGRRNGSVV